METASANWYLPGSVENALQLARYTQLTKSTFIHLLFAALVLLIAFAVLSSFLPGRSHSLVPYRAFSLSRLYRVFGLLSLGNSLVCTHISLASWSIIHVTYGDDTLN